MSLRFIDSSALLSVWTVHEKVDQTYLVLASGKLVLQKNLTDNPVVDRKPNIPALY